MRVETRQDDADSSSEMYFPNILTQHFFEELYLLLLPIFILRSGFKNHKTVGEF